jgi:hypothetical protein
MLRTTFGSKTLIRKDFHKMKTQHRVGLTVVVLLLAAWPAFPQAFENPTQWQNSATAFSDPQWTRPEYGTTVTFGNIFHNTNQHAPVDVCARGSAGVECAPGTGSGFGVPRLVVPNFSDRAGWNSGSYYYGSLRIADVEGTGWPSICARGVWGIVCAHNNGNGTFQTPIQWSAGIDFTDAQGWLSPEYGSTIMFGTFAGSSAAGVCGRAIDGVHCGASTGNGFAPAYFGGAVGPVVADFSDAARWNTQPSYYGSIRIADVNGDGFPDICGRGIAGILCALQIP